MILAERFVWHPEDVERLSDDEPHVAGDKEGHDFHGNQYVYHGTSAENLASIKEHGLRPWRDAKDEYGSPLNFHHVESVSRDYAMFDANDQPQNGVLLRIKKSDLPKDTIHSSLTNVSRTSTVVPPDVIEIEQNGAWKSLRTTSEAPVKTLIARALTTARDAVDRWKLRMALAAGDQTVAAQVVTDVTEVMRAELETSLTTLGGVGSGITGHVTEHEKAVREHEKAVKLHEEAVAKRQPSTVVSTVHEAIPLILAGKVVELKNVHKVNTLLTKLAAIAKDAVKHGDQAPNYDACKITVAGASVFCGGSIRTKEYPNGMPRIVMPQLGGVPRPGSEAAKLPKDDKGKVDAGPEFMDYLHRIGISSKSEYVLASHLTASQNELVGPRIAKRVAQDKYAPSSPIFISRDNFVVDGHHRWSAIVGRDAEDGHLGGLKIHAIRVDAPISEILHIAKKWSVKFGLPGVKA
jgi:hypothetical protein